MVQYTTIDHTADLGIRVTGQDVEALFIHAGEAMFDLIADSGVSGKIKSCSVSAKGRDWPDLMVEWLRELLYLWTGKALLMRSLDIEWIEPYAVSGRVDCVSFDPDSHGIQHDIKAVTYHGIDVRHTAKGWESTIIFDV
jgi:SHS2 domain-containing protein